MSITSTTNEIQCTGLDTEGDKQTFDITILERHLKHLIVMKGNVIQELYNNLLWQRII